MKTSDGVEIKPGLKVKMTLDGMTAAFLGYKDLASLAKNPPKTKSPQIQKFFDTQPVSTVKKIKEPDLVVVSSSLAPESDDIKAEYLVSADSALAVKSGGFFELMKRKAVGPVPWWGVGAAVAMIGGYFVFKKK